MNGHQFRLMVGLLVILLSLSTVGVSVSAQDVETLGSHRPVTKVLTAGSTHRYDYVLRNAGDLIVIVHVHEVDDYGVVHLRLLDRAGNELARRDIDNQKSFGYYDGQIEVELDVPDRYRIEVSLLSGDSVEYMIWAIGRRDANPCLARLKTDEGNLYYKDYGQNTVWHHPDGDDLEDGFHLVNTQDVWAEDGDNYGQVYMSVNDSIDVNRADTRIEIEPLGWIRILEAQSAMQLMNGSVLIEEDAQVCETVLIAGSLRAEYHSTIIASVNGRTGITAMTVGSGTLTVYDQGNTIAVTPGQVYYKNERTGAIGWIRPLSDFGLSSFGQVLTRARQGRDVEGNRFPDLGSVPRTDPDAALTDTGAWFRFPLVQIMQVAVIRPVIERNIGSGTTRIALTTSGFGEDLAARGGGSCVGYAASTPDVRAYLSSANGLADLLFSFDSGSDTTLLVQAPNGQVYCNDDHPDFFAFNTLNQLAPGIQMDIPRNQAASYAGTYSIWVGSFNQGEAIEGTLIIEGRLSID